ncbi:hypothetical protein [Sulfuracidifex tepidarius]|nr:hypothetical protein [Sulfuracidifex tepidarius]
MLKPIFNSFGGGRPTYMKSLDLLISNLVLFVPSFVYLIITIIVPVIIGVPAFLISPSVGLLALFIESIILGAALAVTLLVTQNMVSSSMNGVSPSLDSSFNSAIGGAKASGVLVAIVGAYVIDYLLDFAGVGVLGSLILLIVVILVIPSLSVNGSFDVVLKGGYEKIRSVYLRDPLLALILVVSSA